MSTIEYIEQRQEITSPRYSTKRYKHRFGNKRYFMGKHQPSALKGNQSVAGKRADHTKPISTKRVRAVPVPNKPRYPLSCPLTLIVIEARHRVIVQPSDLRDHLELRASGSDFRQAMADFGRRFDHWVRQNWSLPPHLRNARNERIVRILKRVVNWDQYEIENPLVQPMWGQILEHRADGAIRIFWVFGPQEARNQEAILPRSDVIPALGEMQQSQWFYGTAKSFPDHVAWIEDPEPAPDPEDEAARAAVWEQLPIEFTDEPKIWPMKR